MSDEVNNQLINTYRDQIRDLNDKLEKQRRIVDRVKSERGEIAKQLEAVTAERDELAAGFDALETEHKEFTERAATPDSEKDLRIAELETQLRTRDHKDVFSRLAKAADVREEAIDDLWTLSGYKAEADTVDEAKLGQLLQSLVEPRQSWVKKPALNPVPAEESGPVPAVQSGPSPAVQSGPAAITTPATRPGPGAVRTAQDTTPPAARTAVDRVNAEFSKHSITGIEGRI